MVFVLEDMAKIEADRMILPHLTERHVFTQTEGMFDGEVLAVQVAMNEVMRPLLDAMDRYVWGADIPRLWLPFSEAYFNAIMRGNLREPGNKVFTEVKYGLLGGMVCVQDQGNGFDYRSQIAKVQASVPHAARGGARGMPRMHESEHYRIAYHGSGNLISLATRAFSAIEFFEFRLD